MTFYADDPGVWTEAEVGVWLEKNGFGKYCKVFKDQSIAGTCHSLVFANLPKSDIYGRK